MSIGSSYQSPPPWLGLTVLGSTGSIGCNTLDVVRRHDFYRVFALTANTNVGEMLGQCLEFRPRYAVMKDAEAAERLEALLRDQEALEQSHHEEEFGAFGPTEVLSGSEALKFVASHDETDCVMAAIVGAAGLEPTLAAVDYGKRILLANKEALVMAGDLFMAAQARSQSIILPIDSEHNAIFQCLPPESRLNDTRQEEQGVRRVLLTASGGPFRDWSMEQLAAATPAEACDHPNWDMGRKISVDSATMMNKGLELIEACFLFRLDPEQVEVLIHPQSIVHSMVEYLDGTMLAQMGSPDMRIPISYGLGWPERIASGASFLDLSRMGDLQFFAPDLDRFPCLRLGMEAAGMGGTAPAVLNAANEEAVAAFLDQQIGFTDIPLVIEEVLSQITCRKADSLDIIQRVDAEARQLSREVLNRLGMK